MSPLARFASDVAQVLAIALAPGLVSVACNGDDCDIDAETRELAGPGVTDCSVPGADASVIDSCVLRENASGHPFRALYEQDDGSLEALVLDGGGTYYLVRTPADGSRVERARCKGANVSSSRVECDAPGDFHSICE